MEDHEGFADRGRAHAQLFGEVFRAQVVVRVQLADHDPFADVGRHLFAQLPSVVQRGAAGQVRPGPFARDHCGYPHSAVSIF